jgi:valyl-tRNA synthetase
MTSLAKTYNPQAFEADLYREWEEGGWFRADASSQKPVFTISMPPPNATGQLHVGHAVMLALEDILIRWHRMSGYEALWVPGTDHAAIATENVVLQKIQREEQIKDPRRELGREEVLRRIREYVVASRDTIKNQVRAMGSSCDWSRDRFTMDEQLNRCVNETFRRMYDDGLIYRGHRIVNWDPKLKTNVSDDEVDRREIASPFYTFKYGPFEIGTVRPETKFGDKYVVMHPADERYAHYQHGDTFTCEWINGPVEATIIKDEAVDPAFGTGVMTITPWHDHADFEIAERHGLDKEQIIDFEGKLLEGAGEFAGMEIEKARPLIVEKLARKGLLVKTDEKYVNSKAFNSRGGGAIEPQIREQWFIDVNQPVVEWKGERRSLREILIRVVREGDIRIVPDRFNHTYFHWVENLRDWCISRQIWWGHRVPVWYRGAEDARELFVGVQAPEGVGWQQDEDTLDTWFSSALWTWSTLIDPDKAADFSLSFDEVLKQSPDFQKFHPTQVMETGYDILFFWVARMILMTTYMIREVPFETVYLHGLVRTKEGKKMSKSDPATCIDPLESIAEYGTDALRLALLVGTGPGQDLRLYPEKLEACRRFANKLWNAGRYILINISPDTPITPPQQVQGEISQWLLHQLNEIIADTQRLLEQYRLSDVIDQLRNFFWSEFCDWFLEMDKKPERTPLDDQVLAYSFTTMLRLLHPFVPFVTEALWREFQQPKLLIGSEWPAPVVAHQFPESNARIGYVKEAITRIRSLREKARLGMDRQIPATLESLNHAEVLETHREMIVRLARLTELTIVRQEPAVGGSEAALSAYFDETLATIDAGGVDWSEEIASLKKRRDKEQDFVTKSAKKLSNEGFLAKAPADVVQELRDKVAASEKTIAALEQQIADLEDRSR